MNKKLFFTMMIILFAVLSMVLLQVEGVDEFIHEYEEPIITDEILNETSKIDLDAQTFSTPNKSIPFYKKQLNINYSKGEIITPKYLVIHETNNTNIGADANAHYRYWSTNPTAKASAHFVVDSKQIYQLLELNHKAWHVGDNRGYSDITNNNAIGIEIAVNADGNYDIARQNAIDLTIRIMNDLGMGIDQLKRHFDASGKNCPAIMLANPELWTDFVRQVELGLN